MSQTFRGVNQCARHLGRCVWRLLHVEAWRSFTDTKRKWPGRHSEQGAPGGRRATQYGGSPSTEVAMEALCPTVSRGQDTAGVSWWHRGHECRLGPAFRVRRKLQQGEPRRVALSLQGGLFSLSLQCSTSKGQVSNFWPSCGPPLNVWLPNETAFVIAVV